MKQVGQNFIGSIGKVNIKIQAESDKIQKILVAGKPVKDWTELVQAAKYYMATDPEQDVRDLLESESFPCPKCGGEIYESELEKQHPVYKECPICDEELIKCAEHGRNINHGYVIRNDEGECSLCDPDENSWGNGFVEPTSKNRIRSEQVVYEPFTKTSWYKNLQKIFNELPDGGDSVLEYDDSMGAYTWLWLDENKAPVLIHYLNLDDDVECPEWKQNGGTTCSHLKTQFGEQNEKDRLNAIAELAKL